MKGEIFSYFTICLQQKYVDLGTEFLVLRNTKLTLFIQISILFIVFVEMERLYLFLENIYYEVKELNTEIAKNKRHFLIF